MCSVENTVFSLQLSVVFGAFPIPGLATKSSGFLAEVQLADRGTPPDQWLLFSFCHLTRALAFDKELDEEVDEEMDKVDKVEEVDEEVEMDVEAHHPTND